MLTGARNSLKGKIKSIKDGAKGYWRKIGGLTFKKSPRKNIILL